MMSPPLRALILLVDGVEEMEAVGPCDVLRRAGFEVTMAGLFGIEPITCSERTRILPDVTVDDALKEKYDIVILPGGLKGSENFAKLRRIGKYLLFFAVQLTRYCKNPKVGDILRSQLSSGGYIAAICAATTLLAGIGIQKGATMTSHPLDREILEEAGYKYSEDRVVVDGKLITSRGPGTTLEFALKIVEILVGKEKAKELHEYIVM